MAFAHKLAHKKKCHCPQTLFSHSCEKVLSDEFLKTLMTTINDELSSVLSERKIWIYNDGGASTHGQKTGAYAAMIIFPDGRKHMVVGACNQTKNNRMELSALNAALYYVWAIASGGITHGMHIQIITDSEVTMNGATKVQRGMTNNDLWLQFDELARHFDSLQIHHMSRNLEPAQRQADAACHVFREEFTKLLEEYIAHPKFLTLEMERNTKLARHEKINVPKTKTAETAQPSGKDRTPPSPSTPGSSPNPEVGRSD